jgi:hypothetical protein
MPSRTDWCDLEQSVGRDAYKLENAGTRRKRRGDPWRMARLLRSSGHALAAVVPCCCARTDR